MASRDASAKWVESPCPTKVLFGFDILDKALLYRATREGRTITQNLMRVLYPNWKWGKDTKHRWSTDGLNMRRRPEDVTIEQVLSIFFTHDSLTKPLRRIIENGMGEESVEDHEIVMFLKVCVIYKCMYIYIYI
jgi:hypothetical protein